jgi:hypothetical protein
LAVGIADTRTFFSAPPLSLMFVLAQGLFDQLQQRAHDELERVKGPDFGGGGSVVKKHDAIQFLKRSLQE